jgi:glycerophosphoryl diester phosphodiesterase
MITEREMTTAIGGVGIKKKLIIAHRGAPGFAKENTIESFEKAMALGADMIEFDVRKTQDNVFIVHHDASIQGKPLRELNYGEIDHMARKQGLAIPTVEEVLRYTKGKVKLDVELKEKSYEREIVELLSKYFKEDQYMITSFHDASLKIIKDHYPEKKVGLLLGKLRAPLLTKISEFFPMKRCLKARADFLVAHWKLLRFGFLERAQRSRKSVIVWTVNDEKMMERLFQDRRVYAMITDKPDLAVSFRKRLLS